MALPSPRKYSHPPPFKWCYNGIMENEELTRVCLACSVERPIDQFYRHAPSRNGRQTRCIACISADAKARKARADEAKPANWKMKGRDPAHKAAIARAWAQANRESVRESQRKHYAHRKERVSALNKVRYAIRPGKLIPQPCFMCGLPDVEAHHYDYSMPLDVTWLCKYHHELLHKEAAALDAARRSA